MSVVVARQGRNVVVTVTTGVGDIIDLQGVSNPEKRQQAIQRAFDEFRAALAAGTQTDEQIDAELARHTQAAAARKAARPSGNF